MDHDAPTYQSNIYKIMLFLVYDLMITSQVWRSTYRNSFYRHVWNWTMLGLTGNKPFFNNFIRKSIHLDRCRNEGLHLFNICYGIHGEGWYRSNMTDNIFMHLDSNIVFLVQCPIPDIHLWQFYIDIHSMDMFEFKTILGFHKRILFHTVRLQYCVPHSESDPWYSALTFFSEILSMDMFEF